MSSNSAVVIGGGIGGLATAIGLRLAGWDVTVVERAAVLDDAGAGISLHANGMRALATLGVGEAVEAASRRQYTGGTRTPDGRRLAGLTPSGAMVRTVLKHADWTPPRITPRAA